MSLSTMKPVIVWGFPNCIRCIVLMSGLKVMGIAYEHRNMNDAKNGCLPRSQWGEGIEFMVHLSYGETKKINGQPVQINAEAPQVYDPNIKGWWSREVMEELSKPGYKTAKSENVVPVDVFEHYREGKKYADRHGKVLHNPAFLWNVQENNQYCPCEGEKTIDTKCPCKNFREVGECICKLWVEPSMMTV